MKLFMILVLKLSILIAQITKLKNVRVIENVKINRMGILYQ